MKTDVFVVLSSRAAAGRFSGRRAIGVSLFIALAGAVGCSRRSEAAPQEGASAVPRSSGATAQKEHYRLEFTPVGECKVGSECTAMVRLEAIGQFHINDQYPYKFKANDAAGVEFLGKDAAAKNVFSRAAGDFSQQGEKVGQMSVRFRPSVQGDISVAGVYKMSVCSAQSCEIDQQELSLPVRVK